MCAGILSYMKIVIIGSQNPVKINATREAFEKMFPEENFEFQAFDASSGVSDQPMTTEQTLGGARNRANDCKKNFPGADYWVGIEGGLCILDNELHNADWMVIVDSSGREGVSQTASYKVPEKIKEIIFSGKEQGCAFDVFFNMENSKQKMGPTGLMTDGLITRTDYYAPALMLALVRFKKTDLYE